MISEAPTKTAADILEEYRGQFDQLVSVTRLAVGEQDEPEGERLFQEGVAALRALTTLYGRAYDAASDGPQLAVIPPTVEEFRRAVYRR